LNAVQNLAAIVPAVKAGSLHGRQTVRLVNTRAASVGFSDERPNLIGRSPAWRASSTTATGPAHNRQLDRRVGTGRLVSTSPWPHIKGDCMKTELEKFYSMVEDIEIAMMTTRRPDGHLESRPMANQRRAAGADLWFVTAEGTAKLRDLEADAHVNLSYYKDATREWISVSGRATTTRDRQKIDELYAPDWKIWFPDNGDPRHGTSDDPRFVLIGVDVQAAVFLEMTRPRPVVLYEMAKGWITGETPDLGEMHTLKEPHRK
jgi:general stress protein 26